MALILRGLVGWLGIILILVLVYVELGQPSCSLRVTELLDLLPMGILVFLFAREVLDLHRFLGADIN